MDSVSMITFIPEKLKTFWLGDQVLESELQHTKERMLP